MVAPNNYRFLKTSSCDTSVLVKKALNLGFDGVLRTFAFKPLSRRVKPIQLIFSASPSNQSAHFRLKTCINYEHIFDSRIKRHGDSVSVIASVSGIDPKVDRKILLEASPYRKESMSQM
jgi:hypothetical protein